MTLRLRLRGPSGKQHTANLQASGTLADLHKEAATAFSIAENEVEVLLGVPPSVCAAALNTPLTGLVKSGECATVRQGTGGPATQAVSTAAFEPAPTAVAAPADTAPSAWSAALRGGTTAARGGNIASVRDSEPWDCVACTLQNLGSATKCEACETPRPGFESDPAPANRAGSGGAAQIQKMPDDNSCLFHGIGFLLDPSRQPNSLRQLVANEVQSNPVQWDEATLGKPRAEYIAFIQDPLRWGGQVELNIFSSAYKTEIGVVEVQSGRCDIYGEGSGYTKRVYLLHSGLHFDAVKISGQTQVSSDSFSAAHAAVLQLAAEQRGAGNFVDQDTMRLRCKICGFIAEGDYAARSHAGGTGHKEFAPA